MKILVITNLYPNKFEPTRGVYNSQMVGELAKFCELKVVAPVPWNPFSRLLRDVRLPDKEFINGIEVFHPTHFIIPKIGRALYGLFFFLSLLGEVKKIRNDFRFDLILASWAFPDGVGSYYIAKKIGVPIVVEALGSDINIYTQYWLRRAIISRALSRCNRVIAVSSALKDAMVRVGIPKEKIEVVLNGVNKSVFSKIDKSDARESLGLSQSSKIVLFVGNLVPVKGIDYLIDAFKVVKSEEPNARLILVGDGYLRQSLERRVADHGINVDFVGKISHGEVSLWMNACDVLCLPSINEGCPNVLLEAMACGKRIVASRVGGIPEMVQNYKRVELVPVKSVEKLSKALTRSLMDNPSTEEEVFVTRSWSDAAQEIFEICRNVCMPRSQKRETIKLLVITNLFPNSKEPTRGIFNKQQFKELSRLCDLKVIAPLPWYLKVDVPERELVDGIETFHPRYAMMPKVGRSLYGFLFYLSLIRYVKSLEKENTFDAILATWAYPDAFGSYLIAKKLKKPFIVKVHGSDINHYSSYFLRRKMIAWALSNSDRVIAVSESLKTQMARIGIPAEKIVVVQNGVDTALFRRMSKVECRKKLGLPNDSKIVLYTGNLAPVKNVDVLISAFNELVRKNPEVFLLIVGNGSMEMALREQVKGYGLENKVIFAGRQEHRTIPYYMNAADVLCLPSTSEGCPNVILESNACGCPVVATRTKGITELLASGCGVLAELNSARDFTRALETVVNGKVSDKEYICKDFIWQSWTDNAKSVFKLITEAVSL